MLPSKVLALLRQWWVKQTRKYDAGVPKAERYLFPSREAAHISTRQFNRLFHEAAKAAGIGKRVKALLGHCKLETTAHYASVATGMIAAVQSPLDQLSSKTSKPKTRRKWKEPA